MFCRKCGTPNDDNAFKCTRCGEILQSVPATKIDNNLALAIIVTVLCCLPLGIVGIVHAAQVNAKARGGDITGAVESARQARKWSLWGMGIGIVVYGGYALLAVAGALSGSQ